MNPKGKQCTLAICALGESVLSKGAEHQQQQASLHASWRQCYITLEYFVPNFDLQASIYTNLKATHYILVCMYNTNLTYVHVCD